MSVFCFLAAFLFLQRLNKTLIGFDQQLKWKRKLRFAGFGILGLYVVLQSLLTDMYVDIIGGVVLLSVLLYIKREPDFSGIKFYLAVHYPLAAVGIITGLIRVIVPDFYDNYNNYFQFATLAAFVFILVLWINSKKQREELLIINARNSQLDTLVAQRTAELTAQKNELQNAVELLKATQAQLVQQEKLASLGELTAGIAHEIQNPLNFVNNFSEVSVELLEELIEEAEAGHSEDVIAIANDLTQNLQKINHHGKRADFIVKGMLQHSRTSTGERQPTNINALADEFLKLSYHGLRAKDKSFNADMVTHFDDNLPKVNIVQQDIGRVLLNLFNNAFYAVNQKKKTAGDDYKPTVTVTTFAPPLANGGWGVSVKDNGMGIPNDIKEKIMQPFFTTKPTGEGTGLGLSLSHDIIVKGHGGTINIESKEGEGSEFIIKLPA